MSSLCGKTYDDAYTNYLASYFLEEVTSVTDLDSSSHGGNMQLIWMLIFNQMILILETEKRVSMHMTLKEISDIQKISSYSKFLFVYKET